MSEDASCGRGKDVAVFQKDTIIGMHQAKKTKEIAEITGTGLRTVQSIIKTWTDSGEPSTSRKKSGMVVIRDHLNAW